MRRLPYVRQARSLLATAVLGFTLLGGTAVSVSAMPCGPVRDPVTGKIVNYVLCRQVATEVKPDPCICPDLGTYKYGPEYDPRAVSSQTLATQQMAAPQLRAGSVSAYGP